MTAKAFQDFYPENVAHCFGCGCLNEHGHRIRTYWEKEFHNVAVRPVAVMRGQVTRSPTAV